MLEFIGGMCVVVEVGRQSRREGGRGGGYELW